MFFCKYEFLNEELWNNLKKLIYINDQYIDCAVVELGYLGEKYAVDIMWYNNIIEDFNQYEVFPDPCGVHTFLGMNYLYIERYETRQ